MYLYRLTVTYFGDLEEIGSRHWSVDASVLLHSIISATVQVRTILFRPTSHLLLTSVMEQSYYAYRIYVLSGRRTISILSWSIAVLEVLGGIAITVLLRVGPVAYPPAMFKTTTAIMSLDVTINVLNTSALCYYLHKKRSGVKR